MNKKSFFWASYADLMTSLFFIMLVLFILTVIMLKSKADDMEKLAKATQEQLDKIREIEEAVNNIDTTLFEYKPEHKKHILKIDVSFQTGSSDIYNIPEDTRLRLLEAGRIIREFIQDAYEKNKVKYLLIIEGQASKDNYPKNYELSYNRALALVEYWRMEEINFDADQCEVIISGSGQNGSLRVQPDIANNKANQRFLIHIIPKPGVITKSSKSQEL